MAGKKESAGLMMFYKEGGNLSVFLIHPGGPYWRNKDEGAWSIPKGEPQDGEELLEAAKREFEEETGITPEGEFIPLGETVQKAGKKVYCWAFEKKIEGEIELKSNLFWIEWPPKSGEQQLFPEADKGAYFSPAEAKEKINPAQVVFIERLEGL